MSSKVQRMINRSVAGANAAAAAANARAAAAEQAAAQARAYADEQIKTLTAKYEEQLSKDKTYTALAEQIQALTSGGMGRGAAFNAAVQGLNAGRNFGSSDLSSRLNFQVSDQQIVDDFNQAKLGRLNRIVEDGNAQIEIGRAHV